MSIIRRWFFIRKAFEGILDMLVPRKPKEVSGRWRINRKQTNHLSYEGLPLRGI